MKTQNRGRENGPTKDGKSHSSNPAGAPAPASIEEWIRTCCGEDLTRRVLAVHEREGPNASLHQTVALALNLWIEAPWQDMLKERAAAAPAQSGTRRIELLTQFENAKAKAVGLLDSLSQAYGAARRSISQAHEGQIDWGVDQVANELKQLVMWQWENLEKQWGEVRDGLPEGMSMDAVVMPQKLRAAFMDMQSPLRCAAAAVHLLALALANHAQDHGLFHADGVVGGYEEIGVHFASEILEPIKGLEGWAERGTRPANNPKVAA